MNRKLLGVTGLAFITGLVAFSLLFSGNDRSIERLTFQGDCDLSDSPVCKAQDAKGRSVSLSLSPRPIPLLKDIAVNATVRGLADIRTTQVSIEGVNMYMGVQIIPLTIKATETTEQETRFSGKMQLPVCTSRVMEWRATLMIQTGNTSYQAVFPFTTTAD